MAGIFANYAVNGLNPSTVGGAGTGVFYFPNPPALNVWNQGAAGVNAGVTSNQLGGTPSSTNFQGQLSVPANSEFNGQFFAIRASGNVLFGAGEASTTCKIKINANTGTISSPVITDLLGSNVEFSNVALDGVYLPWTVNVDFEGDTLSGIVQGQYTAIVDGTVVAAAAITNLTGINFGGVNNGTSAAGSGGVVSPSNGANGGESAYAFGLAVGVQFGLSNTGNSANLYQAQLYAW